MTCGLAFGGLVKPAGEKTTLGGNKRPNVRSIYMLEYRSVAGTRRPQVPPK